MNENTDRIDIRVQSYDGNTIHFKMKRSQPLKLLKFYYCDYAGISPSMVHMIIDDAIVTDMNWTPDNFAMKNNGLIIMILN